MNEEAEKYMWSYVANAAKGHITKRSSRAMLWDDGHEKELQAGRAG